AAVAPAATTPPRRRCTTAGDDEAGDEEGRIESYACMTPCRLQVSWRAKRRPFGSPSAASKGAPMAPNEPIAARAFWIASPGRGEMRRGLGPVHGPGSVLVETLYSGSSRGTESLVLAGRVPVSEQARMRAPFQAGRFPGPVKYGYASVGRVLEGPDTLRGRLV